MRCAAIALAVALALVCISAHAGETPKDATENIVAIKVNGKPMQDNAVVLQSPDGDVWLTVQEWTDLGVVIAEQEGTVSSKSLEIDPKFDPSTQTIDFQVPAKLLPGQSLGARFTRVETVNPQPKGAFINYDLAGEVRQDGTYGLSVAHEAIIGVGKGTLVSTGQVNLKDQAVQYRRGLTTWTQDNLSSGTVLQLGDVFTPRSAFGGSVNLAGVRFASDRALRQGEGFYPVPVLGGIAQSNSTAELVVNQAKLGQYGIKPGPYELNQYSLLRGVNDINFTVRDEFGREQVVSERFYANPENLKKGAVEYDIAVGLIRKEAGSDTYGQPAVSGKVEWGVSDAWTTSATVQATQDSRNLTLTNRVVLGTAGSLTLDASGSSTPYGQGVSYGAAYEYINRDWSVRASHTRYSPQHWTLTDERSDGLSMAKLASVSSVGVNLNPRGKAWSVGASAVELRYQNSEATQRFSAAARYRRQADELSLGLSYNPITKDKEIGLSWRKSFGSDLSMSTQVRAAPDLVAGGEVNGRSALGNQEVRWSAGAEYGAKEGDVRAWADASTRMEKGDLNVRVQYAPEQSAISGSFEGSVWVGEGGVSTQTKSTGSFAVVEVEGQAGVPVSSGGGFENATNRRGYAVVPNIRGLASQSVKLNTKDLALEVGMEQTSLPVVAKRKGGAKVKFEVSTQTMRELAITLNGRSLEPPARIASATEEVPVGMGGVAVLENPQPGETLQVLLPDNKRCTVKMPEAIGSFEQVIELECKEEK